MYQGRRLTAVPKRGYQPKRLARLGKRLQEASRRTGTGRMVCSMAVAAALCALALTGAADLSTAYLHDQDSVNNALVIGTVDPSVVETFEDGTGTTKKDVTIQNGGNAPVYIRALPLIYWEDPTSGSVLADKPVAETPGASGDYDYTMTGPAEGWSLGNDGYYYYTTPVQPGDATSKLIETLTDKNTNSARRLVVDIIAQAVQASPAEAVTEAFQGVTIGADGTTLTPPDPPASGGGGAP